MLKTPNITPAQIAAILTFAISQGIAWGVISSATGSELVSAGGAVVAIAWKLADAIIRHGRARALAPIPPAGP